MEKLKKKEWDESYKRHENFIFYPKEEVVKFLNRFVRKRIDVNKFIDIIDFSHGVKGLDFGCGIGRMTILMAEFGIEAYGIDISEVSIDKAKELCEYLGYPELKKRFKVFDGLHIPFPDNFFDLTISSGVLDSMPFEIAKLLIKEIERVTKKLIYIDLISGDNEEFFREFDGEIIVKNGIEKGTVQSYFNFTKILKLIENTKLNIKWCRLIIEEGVIDKFKYGRYHIVLEKEI